MEEQIVKIVDKLFTEPFIDNYDAAKEITDHFKEFIKWKDDLKCPYIVHYNGEDPARPKISYDKGSKNCTLDEVYEFWENSLKP